eukprot:scaffold5062_cov227-Chaetoceros_neogracile.AAC.3
MQRRKNVPTKEAGLRSSPGSGQTSPLPKATVVIHRCGTSPFDKHWLNWDCCGLFCAGLTYGLHIYGCYTVTQVLLPPWMSVIVEGVRSLTFWGKFHSVFFTLVAFLASASHFFAMTTDPGSVPPDAEPLPDFSALDISTNGSNDGTELLVKPKPRPPKRICRRCQSYKPDRAHHCSICKRCILKMDHHCPWWDVVSTNVTHIDRLKGETFMEDLEGREGTHEVFGAGVGKGKKSGFRPDWLSPFVEVCFPENMENDIMGFCRPCSRTSGKAKEESSPTAPNRRRNSGVAEIV